MPRVLGPFEHGPVASPPVAECVQTFGPQLDAGRMSTLPLTPSPGNHPSVSDTVEGWAERYVRSESLSHKVEPPPPPSAWREPPRPQHETRPGRPSELRVVTKSRPAPRSLRDLACQARLLHTFFHHELQAAELMCWALLRFADTELDFRKGLLGIALDEVRHARAYRDEIAALGFRIGDFAVRDWFWQRVPTCDDELQFVALMGMGLEAANLEHAHTYAERLESVGAHRAAALQRQIEREETSHVAFAVHWFSRWAGELDFRRWESALPPPLTPLMMKGAPVNRAARLRAGMPRAFVDAIAQWTPR